MKSGNRYVTVNCWNNFSPNRYFSRIDCNVEQLSKMVGKVPV